MESILLLMLCCLDDTASLRSLFNSFLSIVYFFCNFATLSFDLHPSFSFFQHFSKDCAWVDAQGIGRCAMLMLCRI